MQTETPDTTNEAAGGASDVERVVRQTLRQDLMDAIGNYRDINTENSLAQTKATPQGLHDALRYAHCADAADSFAVIVNGVLNRHGL